MAEETDEEMLEMARLEISELEEKIEPLIEQIQTALIPKDATEHADAVIEIRAGAGGDEAGLFAADLLRMYQRFSEANSWKFDVIDSSETGAEHCESEEEGEAAEECSRQVTGWRQHVEKKQGGEGGDGNGGGLEP